jgi:hypothetical protein
MNNNFYKIKAVGELTCKFFNIKRDRQFSDVRVAHVVKNPNDEIPN